MAQTFLGKEFTTEELYKLRPEYEAVALRDQEKIAQVQKNIDAGSPGNWADQLRAAQVDLKFHSIENADAFRDWQLKIAEEIAKPLGITADQLRTNPQLASDPRALAEYTGKPYGGTDYTPGSEDWYKLHPEERPVAQDPNAQTLGAGGAPSSQTYVVQAGDTLSEIAARLGVPISSISGYRSGNPNLIFPGETLTIGGSGGGSQIDSRKYIQDPNNPTASIPNPNYGKPMTTGGSTSSSSSTGGSGGGTPLSGGNQAGTTTEEQQKEELFKQIQAILDGNQVGSTSAITGDTLKEPDAPDYEKSFEDLKTKYSVEPLENDIADIDKQIADITAQYEQGIQDEKGRLTSTAIIKRRQNALSEEGQIELDRLTRRRKALQDQLDNKYKTIDTLMGLKQLDYNTARGAYEFEFNKAIQGQQLLNQARDDARAVLTTTVNLFKDSELTWNNLTDAQQLGLNKMELSAGLPMGSIQAFMNAKPDSKIIATKDGYDAQGNAITTFVYEDGNGLPGVTYTIKTGGSKGAETDDTRFWLKIDSARKELYGGTSWGTLFNRIKQQFPEKSNQQIDEALGKIADVGGGKIIDWSKEGAYKEYQASQNQSKLTEDWFRQNFPKGSLESQDSYSKKISGYLATVKLYHDAGYEDDAILKLMQ